MCINLNFATVISHVFIDDIFQTNIIFLTASYEKNMNFFLILYFKKFEKRNQKNRTRLGFSNSFWTFLTNILKVHVLIQYCLEKTLKMHGMVTIVVNYVAI